VPVKTLPRKGPSWGQSALSQKNVGLKSFHVKREYTLGKSEHEEEDHEHGGKVMRPRKKR